MNDAKIDQLEYLNEKSKIQDTIRATQSKAMIEANKMMILTYHKIGMIINQREKFGDKYIERLAADLKGYGKGYDVENLKYMAKFSSFFTEDEVITYSIAKIPWDYIIEILNRCNSHDEMLLYIVQTIKNGWSKSILLSNMMLNKQWDV